MNQLDLEGQRVFIRVDFNVPIKAGEVSDDTRLRAALPTIRLVLEKGARVVVLGSHLGRPKGKPVPEMSLKPVATCLADLLKHPVIFAKDCIGNTARYHVENAPENCVVLLENLRFHPGEEQNDPDFAKQLATHADVYINDAFGVAHRAHASVEALVHLLPVVGTGLLIERELGYLSQLLNNPARPFVAILGGAKVSDKIEIIQNLLPLVDRLLIGGAMAYTFLKEMGYPVGRSLVENDKLVATQNIITSAKKHDVTLMLPVDHVVAEKMEAGSPTETLEIDDPRIGERLGLDIGPRTANMYCDTLRDVQTVFWNGPMGVLELEAFAKGTLAVAKAVANMSGTSIIGGGDSIAAVNKAAIAPHITHISTGGGAALEFLSGRTLPGITVLSEV